MPFYQSATAYAYHHPEQNKRIASEPVQLDHDNWLDVQMGAGLIVEIKEDKPAKAKKAEQVQE